MEQNPDFVLAGEDNLLPGDYERYRFHYEVDPNDESLPVVEFNKDRLSPVSEFYERNGFRHDVYEEDEYGLVPEEEEAVLMPRWPQIWNRQQLIDYENKLKAIRVQKQLQQRRERELFVRRIQIAFAEPRHLMAECVFYEYPIMVLNHPIYRNYAIRTIVNLENNSASLMEMQGEQPVAIEAPANFFDD